MLSRTEIERLAAAAHELRPDWPVRSLCTLIRADHAHRAYQDVAVALAWIATDSTTRTPARLREMGPWWTAAQSGTAGATPTAVPRPDDPRCPDHTWELLARCRACISEAKGRTDNAPPPTPDPDQIETTLRGVQAVRAAATAAARTTHRQEQDQ